MKKEDIKVGQIAFIEGSRYSGDSPISECEIIKVGRKYVTVKETSRRDSKLSLKSGVENVIYGAARRLHLSKKSILDKKMTEDLSKVISGYFSYGTTKLTLEKLIKIKEIIDSK